LSYYISKFECRALQGYTIFGAPKIAYVIVFFILNFAQYHQFLS